ncbi:MAG: AAA family ATPase [Gammaproteobacteria bacterium]|nr:MAG: AAA family ATPase [Gammaproteobacteria bacterium]
MPGMQTGIHDLEVLLRSRVPLILVETSDERRALEVFKRLALRTGQPVMRWSVTTGLQRIDLDLQPQAHAKEPGQALAQIKATGTAGLYLLLDFHPYLDDPAHVRMIREIAMGYGDAAHTLVFISHSCTLPAELKSLSARFELALPDRTALEQWIREEAKNWIAGHPGKKVKTDNLTLDHLLKQLGGLTESDARRLIRNAIHDDGAITESDLPDVLRAKYELLDQGGALSFELDTAQFGEVGGLNALKRWLEQRKRAFLDPDPALDAPKGILLVGVQGGGKSLAAKAVAGLWHLPLLRLDFGTLYNKFFGETERNLRSSLRTAEAMAPCVLWIDEIEKAIASGDYDSGTSKRVLGSLLTWLAERDKPVFLVATANRIDNLPPELIRKGRMDEIFFVDLPDQATRIQIFDIHLRKRGQQVHAFNLVQLAGQSEGFSGAEIEQAVVAALYLAHEQNAALDNEHLLAELAQTRPLSVVMAERLRELRDWARDRTVSAN